MWALTSCYLRTEYGIWTVASPVTYGLSTECGQFPCFLHIDNDMWTVTSLLPTN